jgi:isopenicillin N synthase-like dioxygenase
MPSAVPIIDLAPWFAGDAAGRSEVAAAVDAALQDVGFLLVTGHGVPRELRDEVRAAARRLVTVRRRGERVRGGDRDAA